MVPLSFEVPKMKMKKKIVIVKVQCPITTTDPNPKALVYDYKQTNVFQVPIEDVIQWFKPNELKVYLEVQLTVIDGAPSMKVIKKVPQQVW